MAEEVKKKVKKEKIPRVAMPEQEPEVRARNFLEVPTGYTPEMAVQEAKRCLQCGLICYLQQEEDQGSVQIEASVAAADA